MAYRLFAGCGLVVACGLALAAFTGCITSQGPFLGYAGIPIPVSPYWQKEKENEHWFHERYGRAPILGPLTADTPDIGMDPPSDDEVFRKFLEIKERFHGWRRDSRQLPRWPCDYRPLRRLRRRPIRWCEHDWFR